MIQNFNIKTLPKKSLYIGGSILILIILFVIGKRISKSLNSSTEDDAKKEIKSNELTFSQAELSGFADRIERAFSDTFDDEKSIYEVFNLMQTKSDVLGLIVAYGKRFYIKWIFPFKDNLPATMAEKLSNSEINKINEILAAKGINYKF